MGVSEICGSFVGVLLLKVTIYPGLHALNRVETRNPTT